MNNVVKLVVSSFSCAVLLANVDALNHHVACNNYNNKIVKTAFCPVSNGHVTTHKHIVEPSQGKEFRPRICRLDETRYTKAEIRRNARHARKAALKNAIED